MFEYPLNRTVPRQALEASVVEAVAGALDLEPGEVALGSSLQDDLGAESLDYLDIAFQLERRYKVEFPRADLLERAGTYFGEERLVKDGAVTELGLRLLRQAMPEVEPGRLRPGLRAAQVASMFTVQTFARVLDRLLYAKEQTSRTCPECGGALADSEVLPELVCGACGKAVPLPSGDDVLYQDLVDLGDLADPGREAQA